MDTLLEARRTLLLSLENSSSSGPEKNNGSTARNERGQPGKEGAVHTSPTGQTGPAGRDGYNLYRKALFLYSEAILGYFEKRKTMQGRTVSEPEAEPEDFKEKLEEARGLFVQVLERFPGGTWTPDSIEQIARINVWLKRDGARRR